MQPALTEASTLSQFKKTNKQTTKNRLKTWRNEFCERNNARWHPRRGFVLKEMFLATHRLLALRTQANFSHLFPSPFYCPPQLRVFAAKILHAGWHNVSVPLPPSPECSVFRYRRAVGVKSQNPLELPGALTLLNVASPDCHTHAGWKWLFAEGTWFVRSLLDPGGFSERNFPA